MFFFIKFRVDLEKPMTDDSLCITIEFGNPRSVVRACTSHAPQVWHGMIFWQETVRWMDNYLCLLFSFSGLSENSIRRKKQK